MENKAELVKPYEHSGASKKEQVRIMFDSISPNYDRLNHLLTGNQDVRWRKKAIRLIQKHNPQISSGLLLDIATGTGDFAFSALAIAPQKIIGLDLSPGMLDVARQKQTQRNIPPQRMEFVLGDSERLPFPDQFADAITVGFGVRNFENLRQGLTEILRVLKPGGVVVILEPAFPKSKITRAFFHFYFRRIVPLLGRLVSKNPVAYTYLPQSVQAFPSGTEFLDICRSVGFRNPRWIPLTLGSCALYWLEK